MAKYKEIELSDGRKVRVYPPRSIAMDQLLMRRYPDPQPPIVESETVGGGTIRMMIEDDPEYLRKKAEITELRSEKLEELSALDSLRDIKVPDDWSTESFAYLALLADPDWQPREGKSGRKLDYIEWDLLGNPADTILVQEVRAQMMGIDMEVIDAIEASFRGDVEG
jgi:hypothetical protein